MFSYLAAKKLYNFSIAAFTLLSIYSIGVATFTIADAMIAISICYICIFLLLTKNTLIIQSGNPLSLFLIYLFLSLMMHYFETDIVLRSGRFLLYLLFVALFSYTFFDIEIALKYMFYIAVFATGMIYLQFVVYRTTGIYIDGYIPFLKLMNEELIEFGETIGEGSIYTQRMRSIFAEPSQYGSYVCITLALILTFFGNNSKKYIWGIFFTLGILISGAATGIITVAIIWMVEALSKMRTKINVRRMIVVVFSVAVIVIISTKAGLFDIFFGRMESGGSVEGRFAGYSMLKQLFGNDTLKMWLGTGMNDRRGAYLAGWARMIYYFGILGTALYIIPLIIYSIGNKKAIGMLLLLIILSTGSAVIVGGDSMILLSAILVSRIYSYESA